MALAGRQHGIVTTSQLLDAGVGRRAIARRVARGWLIPRFRSVYQVGPVTAEHGREMAAVLACGEGAALSHLSAAAIWGFAPDRGFTRSEAERRLKRLCELAGLPAPRTNARVAGYEVDAYWPEQRLIVEVDGWTYHRTREAFERDRRRNAALQAAGYRVVRITWRRLTNEPYSVTAQLGALLSVRLE